MRDYTFEVSPLAKRVSLNKNFDIDFKSGKRERREKIFKYDLSWINITMMGEREREKERSTSRFSKKFKIVLIKC